YSNFRINMDKITNRIIAHTHLSQFKDFALDAGKATIERVVEKWDALSKTDSFDDFVGCINAIAQSMSATADVERGKQVTAASVMGARCGSLLVKEEGRLSMTVKPSVVGGGQTGIKPRRT